jgi:hypothetical protein
MKKIGQFVVMMAIVGTVNSQKTEEIATSDNELKLNAFNVVALKALDVNYEYLLSENYSAGAGLLIKINKDGAEEAGFGNIEADNNRHWSVTPYLRRYFSKSYAKGLFFEGFGMLNSGETAEYDITEVNTGSGADPTYEYEEVVTMEKYTAFALGISVGGKFSLKNGFVTEVYFGMGRNFSLPISGITRGGISLGYRF